MALVPGCVALARLPWVAVDGPEAGQPVVLPAPRRKPALPAAPQGGKDGSGAGPATAQLEATFKHTHELNVVPGGVAEPLLGKF